MEMELVLGVVPPLLKVENESMAVTPMEGKLYAYESQAVALVPPGTT